MKLNSRSKKEEFVEENSFDNSDESCNDDESDVSIEERHRINQSSLMRASRIESKIDQINPNDLAAYNSLIEQFNP
jgi:hypothetical protein